MIFVHVSNIFYVISLRPAGTDDHTVFLHQAREMTMSAYNEWESSTAHRYPNEGNNGPGEPILTLRPQSQSTLPEVQHDSSGSPASSRRKDGKIDSESRQGQRSSPLLEPACTDHAE
jgi:hypothetical protein